MKRIALFKSGIFFLSLFSVVNFAYADAPVWTFSPLTPTTISLSTVDTATIQYQVTNQSSKSHVLEMRGITGVTQNTTSGNCANPFTLGYQQSCTLTLVADGSALQGNVVGGPVVCKQGSALECYQPSAADLLNITLTAAPGTTTLSVSVSTLALSVNNTGLNPALTGTPRRITITNTGSSSATNVTYSPSPALPSGTTINPSSCGTITASNTCVLTITPGATASAAPYDTSPTPITLTIAGSNTNTLIPSINILTYGSFYQGGYVYSVDDTTVTTGSIAGSVVTTSDQVIPQTPGSLWSSNSSGNYDAGISLWGIDETSTPISPSPNASSSHPATLYSGQSNCSGATDGVCDSNNIYVYYQTYAAGAPINTNYYAAGLCKVAIEGYSDWYLPAICQMESGGAGCSGGQAMATSLPDLLGNGSAGSNACTPGAGCLSNFYWSSTEGSADTIDFAWYEYFSSSSTFAAVASKGVKHGVRCTRDF